jgi:hypothetical protein
MSKTYSVAILNKKGIWITNWHMCFQLDEINFEKVEDFCRKNGDIGYGYYYGEKSNNLTSDRYRTLLKIVNRPEYSITDATKILINKGRVFYDGQPGLQYENRMVWLKVRQEVDGGVTAQLGVGTDDKITTK